MSPCYRFKVRTARKPHTCCECGCAINAGQQYVYHHGVWDGEGKDYKVCVECDALRDVCDRDSQYGEGMAFGDLAEWVAEIRADTAETASAIQAFRSRRAAARAVARGDAILSGERGER
jgi:hypothetical protein